MRKFGWLLKLIGRNQVNCLLLGMMRRSKRKISSRALNALYSGVANEEFMKISSIEIAKEAWTILETTYEGT